MSLHKPHLASFLNYWCMSSILKWALLFNNKRGGYVMKKLMIILCAFFLVAVFGCATSKNECPVYVTNPNCKLVSFKAGTEPEGYNGIKWETKLSTLERMKHTRTDPTHGGIEFYVREGDTFRLENGKHKTVQYGFWREKFYVAMVSTKGLEEWDALKQAVFKKYGEGAKPFLNQEEYLWVGKNVIMALQYNQNLSLGTYYIRSESLAKQMAKN
jgi:hypothetical protein